MNDKIKKILEELPTEEDLFDKFISDNDMMVHWVRKNEDGTISAEIRINLYSEKLNLCFSKVELITWNPRWDIDFWGTPVEDK